MTAEDARPCRFCRAAYDADSEMCSLTHSDRPEVAALALAMARVFQDRNPTDEQVGWFMQDADAVVDDFDPVPDGWRVRKLPDTKDDGFDLRFRVNGATYVVESGEGYILPVRLSTLRTQQRDANALGGGP